MPPLRVNLRRGRSKPAHRRRLRRSRQPTCGPPPRMEEPPCHSCCPFLARSIASASASAIRCTGSFWRWSSSAPRTRSCARHSTTARTAFSRSSGICSRRFSSAAPDTRCLRNEHVRIDVIAGRLSKRTQAWIDILGTLFFLLPMAILLMWLSWPVFIEAYVRQRSIDQRRRPYRLAGAAAGPDRLCAARAAGNLRADQAHRFPDEA